MKIEHKSNFRVVVAPRRLGDYGFASIGTGLLYGRGPEAQKEIERDYLERCEEIVSDIKRHTDNVGSVNIEYDTDFTCSYCHYNWEDDEEGIPCCCDKAQKEVLDSKDEDFRQKWSAKYGVCLP